MKTPFCMGILAAALVSGAASATEITVGESKLVIDVEFWGRYQLRSPSPTGGNKDVVTGGDPVYGKFRIFPGNAPAPTNTHGFLDQDAKVYGLEPGFFRPPSGASFVTSEWLSPLPVGITHQVSPFPGSVADDDVIIGDAVRFEASGPKNDLFELSDRFLPSSSDDTLSGESLFVAVHAPLDFLDGLGLDQAFELNDLQETEGAVGYGFFQAKIGDAASAFHEFFVDRLRVTPHVCRM